MFQLLDIPNWLGLLCVQVVMCLVWTGGKLALSFYTVDSAHLYVMPDMAESDDFGLLKRGQLYQVDNVS